MKRLLLFWVLLVSVQAAGQRNITLELEILWSATSYNKLQQITPNDTIIVDGITPNYFAWQIKNIGPDSLFSDDTIKITSSWGQLYSWHVGKKLFVGDTLLLYPDDTTWKPIPLSPGGSISETKYEKTDWCDSVHAVVDKWGLSTIDYELLDNNECVNLMVYYVLGIADKVAEEVYLKLYPNPAKQVVTIAFTSYKNAEVKIANMIGETVYTKMLGKLSGEQKVELQLPELAKGIYLLQLRTGEELSTQKLLIE